MCGIVGIVDSSGSPVSELTLRAMNDCIAHRGPDDEGAWLGEGAGLAMRRLAIIDVAGGRQPIFNEDRSVVVVYNGEIYNYRELRESLVEQGHRLRSQTDSEIIPHLYEEYGEDFVERLNGMFAIALWDRRCRKLLMTRDRIGIKPLFYTQQTDGGGRLLFASELKSLVKAGIDCEIDPAAVYHYMTFGYVPAPMTIYRRVHKLPPGHTAIFRMGRLVVSKYWNLVPQSDGSASEECYLDELDSLLQDAVQRRMISDVPLGAFLSGGVDSSLVVALMARSASQRVRTFNISFAEKTHDESGFAEAVATHFGTEHHTFQVRPDVAEDFEQIVSQFDEPFADASAIPTYYLSKLTRGHVTVALSGDGGDEVFAGYDRYREYFRKRPLYSLPRVLRRGTAGLVRALVPRGVRGRRFMLSLGLDPKADYVVGDSEFENRDLLSPEFLPREAGVDSMNVAAPYLNAAHANELDALCLCDLKLYLPDDILTKVDRMSMAVSLEVRVPLLDHRVVEFGFRLPVSLRLRGQEGKYLLKKLLCRYLPENLVYRPKKGFGIPLGKWFRKELRPLVEDLLSESALRRTGIFNASVVQRLLRMHFSESRNFQARIWRILVVQFWANSARSAARRSVSR